MGFFLNHHYFFQFLKISKQEITNVVSKKDKGKVVKTNSELEKRMAIKQNSSRIK